MRQWGTLEKLGLAAYQKEDKGPEVGKAPQAVLRRLYLLSQSLWHGD